MFRNNLIIDVGSHKGEDTMFYLEKGFNVVSIEANKSLVNELNVKFQKYISDRRLIIENVAIADTDGEIDFYIHNQESVWSTIIPEWAKNNCTFDQNYKVERVKSVCFLYILKKYGSPYYLKIDIEGADQFCIEALKKIPEKPKYISVETDRKSLNNFYQQINCLYDLGYRDFKLIQQSTIPLTKMTYPPLIGNYIDKRFESGSSGPFGEETKGNWKNIEQIIIEYKKILKQQKKYGDEIGEKNNHIIVKIYRSMMPPMPFLRIIFRKFFNTHDLFRPGWHDIHARHNSQIDG